MSNPKSKLLRQLKRNGYAVDAQKEVIEVRKTGLKLKRDTSYRRKALLFLPYICIDCGFEPKEWKPRTKGDKSPRLTVHHKDFNNKNNELSNLEFLCWTCHCRKHFRLLTTTRTAD